MDSYLPSSNASLCLCGRSSVVQHWRWQDEPSIQPAFHPRPGAGCLGTNCSEHKALEERWCIGGLLSWKGNFEASGPYRMDEGLRAWAPGTSSAFQDLSFVTEQVIVGVDLKQHVLSCAAWTQGCKPAFPTFCLPLLQDNSCSMT